MKILYIQSYYRYVLQSYGFIDPEEVHYWQDLYTTELRRTLAMATYAYTPYGIYHNFFFLMRTINISLNAFMDSVNYRWITYLSILWFWKLFLRVDQMIFSIEVWGSNN